MEMTMNENGDFTNVVCKNCSSSNTVKHGFNYTVRGKIQRYFCKDCNHNFN